MAAIVNSDFGLVFGYRGTWLGQESNDGATQTGILNVGSYFWGFCILTGAYRSASAVVAFFTSDEEAKADLAKTMGGSSKTFLATQFCRGVGEMLHLSLFFVVVDGTFTGIRYLVHLQNQRTALQHQF